MDIILDLQQNPIVQRTSGNLNYGIFSSARHQAAVSYSPHWSGVAYTRAELVRWLGLTAVKGRGPRIR
jgi:hypothetical protein